VAVFQNFEKEAGWLACGVAQAKVVSECRCCDGHHIDQREAMMASRREIELGKLATSLGFDLVKVISRGARGEFEQYGTYRIYDANTDVLLVPSLEGLGETEAELALYAKAAKRRRKQKAKLGTEATRERLDRALALRNAGKTLREIGAEFGVTVERARQMVLEAGLWRGNWAYNLTARARNVLGNYLDIDVTKMDELEAAKAVAAALSPRDWLRVPNAGRKTLQEISAWLASHGLASKEAPPRVDRQAL
jgi:hypothetical protein